MEMYTTTKIFTTLIVTCLISSHLLVALEVEDVRLVAGKTPNEGRIELYFDDQWGPVCQRNDIRLVSVLCRQLGLSTFGTVIYNHAFQRGTGTTFPMSLNCGYTAQYISNCSQSAYNPSEECTQLSAKCSLEPFSLSLNYNRYIGCFTIYVQGFPTGYVSNDGWDATDASVACRQLGFRGGTNTTCSMGNVYVYVTNVRCQGYEEHLAACEYSTLISQEPEATVAGVICDVEDACLSNPCINGGICMDLVDGYACNCLPDMTGQQCESVEDQNGSQWFLSNGFAMMNTGLLLFISVMCVLLFIKSRKLSNEHEKTVNTTSARTNQNANNLQVGYNNAISGSNYENEGVEIYANAPRYQ